MSAEGKSELELEIAHVLFIDTVGYSKLLMHEQRKLLEDLNAVVRETECFRTAEALGKLIRLPTGDGMALVFAENPEAPLQCAVEISQITRHRQDLPLRMGIHSGPISRVVDVNDRPNIAGSGINIAQRVMNFADNGHILLSKRAADDLAQHPRWHPYLYDLGEWEVKHGARIGLVNLCTPEAGNADLPVRLKQAKKEQVARLVAARARFRRNLLAVGGAALVLSAICLDRYLISRTPKKSIAVLPFTILNDEARNAFFANGILDEILTDLAKVADLKVISRTSSMQYAAAGPRNIREIAKRLGVANILEGSIQSIGNQVRVNVQLIDAEKDTHLWAHDYDRNFSDLKDVFALESYLAETIVTQLRSHLSPAEKAAIEKPPTTDEIAYVLYVRAQMLISASVYTRGKENRSEAVQLLDQAIARDPAFFAAYCQLVRIHSELYLLAMDHTPERLALADAALSMAQRLQPDAGEAYLALAIRSYCSLDYDHAQQQLLHARNLLPNDPLVFEFAGFIDRRQGRWNEAAENLERALDLDPLNFYFLQQISQSYEKLRRFDDMVAVTRRALAVVPDDPGARIHLGEADFFARADTRPLRAILNDIVLKDPEMKSFIAIDLIHVALCERDFAAAEQALAAMPARGGNEESFLFPKAWYAGMIARVKGDAATARTQFISARNELEKTANEQASYAQPRCVLGMIDAALGNTDQAMREGRQAVALLPVSKDSINGALMLEYLAITYAWCAEKEKAVEQLGLVASIPSDINYGNLKLHPFWDPLRGDPRFEQIVASLAPKQ